MTAVKQPEKSASKRHSFLGMLIVIGVNIFFMSVCAWFLLLVGFGVYGIVCPNKNMHDQLQAIAKPNVAFLQKSKLFQAENLHLHNELKKLNEHTADIKFAALQHQLAEIKPTLSKTQKKIDQHWHSLRIKILLLVKGTSIIVITRVIALCLYAPFFLLCLSLGFVDGLVQRDIRKYQGMRESTFIFHQLKRWSGFWFYIPLFIYLMLPVPISPQWFLLPIAIMLGCLIQMSTKFFKKYI